MSRKLEAVNDAVQYIERHLSEKLELSDVARAVHYSKYHLHRVFTETAGLTIHDYIKRRQLTAAAKLLVDTQNPIIRIAQEAGYETQQAFSTVFKDMYKQTPNQFRDRSKFYPLQLAFLFRECRDLKIQGISYRKEEIRLAEQEDISCWMDLVRFVVDGFPCLEMTSYVEAVTDSIFQRRAFILKDQNLAIGVMILSDVTGSIDFLAVHPLFRRLEMIGVFIRKAVNELSFGQPLSITTFRAGDKADTGYRKTYRQLGFLEAEFLTEFNYPTQRLILK